MSQLSIDFLTIPQVRATRDAAIEQVAGNAEEWIDEALACTRRLLPTFPVEFLAETIRERLVPEIGPPHSHKAWGALTVQALKAGLIVRTGEYRITRSKKTHGHRTAVYRAGFF